MCAQCKKQLTLSELQAICDAAPKMLLVIRTAKSKAFYDTARAEMPRLIENGFTDGQQNTWETLILLRGEGYSKVDIFELFKMKCSLQLRLRKSNFSKTKDADLERIFLGLESIVK